MARRMSFSKHYTHSNKQLNKVSALWKYSDWWASSSRNGFQKNFFQININIQTYNWTKYELCESTMCVGLQAQPMAFRKFIETLYSFKHTIEKRMLSVEVQWVVGFKQKQRVSGEVFQNIIYIQAYNSTKYALCESTASGGLQAEAMGFRRSFSKYFSHSNKQLNKICAMWKYTEWWASRRKIGFQKKFFMPFKHTHSNIQMNNVCALWKKTEWWASSRSNAFQKKFFKRFYTFKHTFEQCMRSLKVHWVVGFNQKQLLSEEVFQKQFTHSNIQLHKVCAL